MGITNDEAKKNVRALVKNNNGTIDKVVDLQDVQVGTTSTPKNLTVTGVITGTLQGTFTGSLSTVQNGNSYLAGSPGITVVSQSSGQIVLSNPSIAPPDTFSGLKIWCEAAAANVTLNTSAPTSVSKWNDLSGNGNHLGQTTKANQPRWYAANPLLTGSQPSLELQSNQLLSSSNLTLTSFTMILALQAKSTATIWVEHSADVNTNDGSWIFGGSAASTAGAMINAKRGGNASGKDHAWLGQTWAPNDEWPTTWVQTFNGTAASHRMYIRGVDISGAGGPGSDIGIASTTKPLFVGGRGSGPAIMSSGSLYAIAVYTPALNPYQALKVARYFAAKFGIAMSG